MEKRYGKNRIRRMIDGLISEEWLVENTGSTKSLPSFQHVGLVLL